MPAFPSNVFPNKPGGHIVLPLANVLGIYEPQKYTKLLKRNQSVTFSPRAIAFLCRPKHN